MWIIAGAAATAIIGAIAYRKMKAGKTGEASDTGEMLSVSPENEQPKTEARWDLLQKLNRPTENLTAY